MSEPDKETTMMQSNESTRDDDLDRHRSTDAQTNDTDDGRPHPHWLFRARLAHERLSGGDD